VELTVYNPVGQQVATLAQGWRPGWTHTVHQVSRDVGGAILASGMLRTAAIAAMSAWIVALPVDASSGGSRFICAGAQLTPASAAGSAAKPVAVRTEGTRNAIALFATFADGDASQTAPPAWSSGLLDPHTPGSFSHFYDTMSFGELQVRGKVAGRRYFSRHSAEHYLSDDPTQEGRYGEFCREILSQADEDIDFSRFDNDGPDGVPASGDDDGVVDALFVILDRMPDGFIRGRATGAGKLGLEEDYIVTGDSGRGGEPVMLSTRQGVILQGHTYTEAVGAMCHEYGHVLGLPDLYNTTYTSTPGAGPEEDSAGIGAWGLMGRGALGWDGVAGPNSFCAWSRWRLGWAEELEPQGVEDTFTLEDVGIAGQVYRIPLSDRGFFLLEYRRRTSSHYDRAIPAEGLLVWHVERSLPGGGLSSWWQVDLECADGRWDDAGYPHGRQANPDAGEDNLDFWSHDEDYRTQHHGNLGDSTDPFDGVALAAFTPDTNPASSSNDGAHSIRLEGIAITNGRVTGQVRTAPPVLELRGVSAGSGRLAAGEDRGITFTLANTGGGMARGLRAVLRSDDPVVEIVRAEIELPPLRAGGHSYGSDSSYEFLRVGFPVDLEEEHQATVELSIYAGDELLFRTTCSLTGFPVRLVTCRVVGPAGEPLAGARVSWRTVSAWQASSRGSSTTDSAGVVELHLAPAKYTFTAYPPRPYSLGWVRHDDIRVDRYTELEFSLPRLHEVHGVVRDADGRPVPDVEVTASEWHWAESSADGSFTLRLPAGEHDIAVRQTSGGSYLSQRMGQVEVPAQTVLALTLEKGPTLTIRVVDEGGVGIAGVQFWLSSITTYGPDTGSLTTHSGGRATAEIPPGVYEIWFDPAPLPYLVPDVQRRLTVLGDTLVTIALIKGVALRGNLVGENGEPVSAGPWAYLTLDPEGDGRGQGASLDKDAFAVAVRPGRYRCRLSAGSSDLPSQGLGTVEVVTDTTIRFAVRRGVSVSGRINGVRVAHRGNLQVSSVDGSVGTRSVRFGAFGTFSIRLVPGQYAASVAFWGDGPMPPSQPLGTFHVARDTVLAWRLGEDELAEGRVVDVRGDGVPGIWVRADGSVDGGRVSNQTTTDGDGVFAMRLPAAAYSLQVERQSSGDEWEHDIWPPAHLVVPMLEPLMYTLPGGALLKTRISDDTGHPASAWLELQSGGFDLREHLAWWTWPRSPTHSPLMTRVPGDHEIDLAPGRYTAVVSYEDWGHPVGPPSYERIVSDLLVEGETELMVSLPRSWGDFTVAGRATGAGGSESAASHLHLYEESKGLLVTVQIRDGGYEAALPAGVYQVALRLTSQEGVAVHELGAISVDGDRTWDIDLTHRTAIAELVGATPHHFVLAQNYPNPFNSNTTIGFSVPEEGFTELMVYDLLGQPVRSLVREQVRPGQHVARWDGRDGAGRPVASGVYLYRLVAGGRAASRKLLLLQ